LLIRGKAKKGFSEKRPSLQLTRLILRSEISEQECKSAIKGLLLGGLAIDKESATVERAGRRGPEELLGADSRPVGHDQKDQQRQQQGVLHNGAPMATT
jgi:hypothetical protein